MSVAVRLTERAVADLEQAFQWYEEQKPDLGYRFMARVDEALDLIGTNPTLFAPQIKDARRILVEQFPYALWYKVSDDAIVIVCVHTHRSPNVVKSRIKLEPK